MAGLLGGVLGLVDSAALNNSQKIPNATSISTMIYLQLCNGLKERI